MFDQIYTALMRRRNLKNLTDPKLLCSSIYIYMHLFICVVLLYCSCVCFIWRCVLSSSGSDCKLEVGVSSCLLTPSASPGAAEERGMNEGM